jgi:hypothetical protein
MVFRLPSQGSEMGKRKLESNYLSESKTHSQPTSDRQRPPRRVSVLKHAHHKPSSIVDTLFDRMTLGHEPFWSTVYPMFVARDLSRDDVRRIVVRGLEQTGGNYSRLAELFNISPGDEKRFRDFLRRHRCGGVGEGHDDRRAKRYPMWVPLRYRQRGEDEWREAVTENISRTGVLFRAAQPVAVDASIEILIAPPAEIFDETDGPFVCHGRVVRTDPREAHEWLAAATLGQCLPIHAAKSLD